MMTEGAKDMRVSAVVVSRMDRPLGPVLDAIIPHVEELFVVRGVGGVWERWRAIQHLARTPVVYTQDDDAIVDVPAVLAAYDDNFVTCNMPQCRRAEYPDGIALVGWGAVFYRKHATVAFDRYGCERHDEIFYRECDRVFTGLSPLKLLDVPVEHLPYAYGADRMGKEARHGADLAEIRRRIYKVRQVGK